MKKQRIKSPDKVWADFKQQEGLSDRQIEQFRQYEAFLCQRNKEYNLTAITDLPAIVRQHFQDSLALKNQVDLTAISCVADIGTGAGFPALPLKILYPHLEILLIEVTKKKVRFLQEIVALLELADVSVCEYDWRTFLRKTSFDVDLFITRAALGDVELCRIFKPSSPYNQKQLVYWATQDWQPHVKAASFVRNESIYKLGSRQRKLVFFGLAGT